MTTEHDQGDYVLVHKSKAKISRARKMIIGVMAIGAVAAMTGAGTFASFSASTTNDGLFRTGRLELSNSKNGASACLSTDAGPGQTSTADANLDTNDTACDALFTVDLRPGVTSTVNIQLHNSSSYANGELYLFGTDDVDTGTTNVCASVINSSFRGTLRGSSNLCDAVKMTVQEYSDAFSTASDCVFPNTGVTCATLNDASQPTTIMKQFPWNFNVVPGDRDLGAFTTTTHTTGDRYFQIAVRLPTTAYTATGFAADNQYQNLKPTMKLRWLIQDQP